MRLSINAGVIEARCKQLGTPTGMLRPCQALRDQVCPSARLGHPGTTAWGVAQIRRTSKPSVVCRNVAIRATDRSPAPPATGAANAWNRNGALDSARFDRGNHPRAHKRAAGIGALRPPPAGLGEQPPSAGPDAAVAQRHQNDSDAWEPAKSAHRGFDTACSGQAGPTSTTAPIRRATAAGFLM